MDEAQYRKDGPLFPTPKGLQHSAQGCDEGATLGKPE